MIIGLTGGIGSGKSTVARELREMGYAVYDTDSQAKRLIVKDMHVREQIEGLFGKEVYQDGVYQTHLVAEKVFAAGNSDLLARLNAIVHPAVKTDILRWANSIYSSPTHAALDHAQPLFVECAILYQAGFDLLCDCVVVVTAPEDVRLQRVVTRDHTDIDKVRARMRAQSCQEDLLRADIIINNDGTTPVSTLCEQLIAQIKSNPSPKS